MQKLSVMNTAKNKRERKRKNKECLDCDKPVAPGLVFCRHHRDIRNKREKKNRGRIYKPNGALKVKII